MTHIHNSEDSTIVGWRWIVWVRPCMRVMFSCMMMMCYYIHLIKVYLWYFRIRFDIYM